MATHIVADTVRWFLCQEKLDCNTFAALPFDRNLEFPVVIPNLSHLPGVQVTLDSLSFVYVSSSPNSSFVSTLTVNLSVFTQQNVLTFKCGTIGLQDQISLDFSVKGKR